MSKYKNGFSEVLLILVIAVILGLVGLFLYQNSNFRQSSVEKNSNVNSNIETSGNFSNQESEWLVYKNKFPEFQFSYPAYSAEVLEQTALMGYRYPEIYNKDEVYYSASLSYQLNEDGSILKNREPRPPHSPIAFIKFAIRKTGGNSIEEIVKNNVSTGTDTEEIIAEDLKGIQTSTIQESTLRGKQLVQTYYIYLNEDYYLESERILPAENNTEVNNLFDQILSTFAFTN